MRLASSWPCHSRQRTRRATQSNALGRGQTRSPLCLLFSDALQPLSDSLEAVASSARSAARSRRPSDDALLPSVTCASVLGQRQKAASLSNDHSSSRPKPINLYSVACAKCESGQNGPLPACSRPGGRSTIPRATFVPLRCLLID